MLSNRQCSLHTCAAKSTRVSCSDAPRWRGKKNKIFFRETPPVVPHPSSDTKIHHRLLKAATDLQRTLASIVGFLERQLPWPIHEHKKNHNCWYPAERNGAKLALIKSCASDHLMNISLILCTCPSFDRLYTLFCVSVLCSVLLLDLIWR